MKMISVMLAMALAHATAAQAQASVQEKEQPPKTLTPDTERAADDETGMRPFGGIRFGVGLSLTSDKGSNDRVGGAVVDPGGIVRVTDVNNNRARVMLEAHYFLTPCRRFLWLSSMSNDCYRIADPKDPSRTIVEVAPKWGVGPFVALQPGGDKEVIDAIGIGLMVGLRRGTDTRQSFNLGVGYVVDPDTQVLGDGIRENQPLPAGETEVRFKETAQTGWLFIASFSF